jgi:hypothetical protein
MSHLSDLVRVLAGLLAALLLQGCGPGVGGTGTGQGLDAFGAAPASVCTSDIASALGCTGAAAAGLQGGSTTVYFVDTIDGLRVAVTVQGNQLELSAPCARVSFRGQWGLVNGQAARFYGFNNGDSQQPTQVLAALDAGGLQLTVLTATGDVLLGPVLVSARPAAGTPGGC